MGKKSGTRNNSMTLQNFEEGLRLFRKHPVFARLYPSIREYRQKELGCSIACIIDIRGVLKVNTDRLLEPLEWVYLLGFQTLHYYLGQFDAEKITGKNAPLEVPINKQAWNLACDVYVCRFMKSLQLGKNPFPELQVPQKYQDEREIYQYLMERPLADFEQEIVRNIRQYVKMEGLEHPTVYQEGRENNAVRYLSNALLDTAKRSLSDLALEKADSSCRSGWLFRQREWIMNRFPMLGSLAHSFQLIWDAEICNALEIQIAAVDVTEQKIYVNDSCYLSPEELRFVLAHELLHAGLLHHARCNGRNPYLWNIACDYVINDWLNEMNVGSMPENALYEKEYHGLSAESIYDILVSNIRKSMKLYTLRGYGKGDVIGKDGAIVMDSTGLDEHYRKAISMGLDYHRKQNRGYLPASLVEEIRAIQMPVIPWDVKLADWFQIHIAENEQIRSYARPSRRQSSTPDIPRAGRKNRDNEVQRTFGVLIDTSGSMDVQLLAKALGSISSLADAKGVRFVRVVFCDAKAYDAGYLSTEEIADRVKVKGRGGTRLQPGIDLLESAKDFPKEGAILIITDGEIEDRLKIRRDHAFLVPRNRRLPFQPRGEVFYFR